MKRKEETQIMMDALIELGINPGDKLQTAIESGLKRIRAAKHQERAVAKQKWQSKKKSVKEPEVDE